MSDFQISDWPVYNTDVAKARRLMREVAEDDLLIARVRTLGDKPLDHTFLSMVADDRYKAESFVWDMIEDYDLRPEKDNAITSNGV